MDTSTIRVEAVAEADVGGVVLGEDRLGVLLVDLELGFGRLFEPLDVRLVPRVGRVGDEPHHDGRR
jgi:hypothetical protein